VNKGVLVVGGVRPGGKLGLNEKIGFRVGDGVGFKVGNEVGVLEGVELGSNVGL